MRSEKILETLLRAVYAPFSQYKETYNKLLNAKDLVHVNLNEDSEKATIVENALIVAGLSGYMNADVILRLLKEVEAVDVRQGRICRAYKNDRESPSSDDSIIISNVRI